MLVRTVDRYLRRNTRFLPSLAGWVSRLFTGGLRRRTGRRKRATEVSSEYVAYILRGWLGEVNNVTPDNKRRLAELARVREMTLGRMELQLEELGAAGNLDHKHLNFFLGYIHGFVISEFEMGGVVSKPLIPTLMVATQAGLSAFGGTIAESTLSDRLLTLQRSPDADFEAGRQAGQADHHQITTAPAGDVHRLLSRIAASSF